MPRELRDLVLDDRAPTGGGSLFDDRAATSEAAPARPEGERQQNAERTDCEQDPADRVDVEAGRGRVDRECEHCTDCDQDETDSDTHVDLRVTRLPMEQRGSTPTRYGCVSCGEPREASNVALTGSDPRCPARRGRGSRPPTRPDPSPWPIPDRRRRRGAERTRWPGTILFALQADPVTDVSLPRAERCRNHRHTARRADWWPFIVHASSMERFRMERTAANPPGLFKRISLNLGDRPLPPGRCRFDVQR